MTTNFEKGSQNFYKPTSDVDNGYIQVLKNQLFRGEGQVLQFDKDAYYILRNPENSGVNVFIRTIFISNNSTTPISSKIIYYGKIAGDLKQSCSIASGNTYDTTPNNKAIILSGIDVSIKKGIEVITYNIPPCHSYRTQAQGSVLVAPGMNHIVRVSSLNCGSNGTCVVGFDWWEESIRC